jgi:hypothetical protein
MVCLERPGVCARSEDRLVVVMSRCSIVDQSAVEEAHWDALDGQNSFDGMAGRQEGKVVVQVGTWRG